MAMTFDATLKDMDFSYEIERLWNYPADEMLKADLGIIPLAVLGQLPEELSVEDGLSVVAQRLAERIVQEAPSDRARKLLTDAYLLMGLRLRRDAAARIFRGVRVMHESDTYLAILDEGQEKFARKAVLSIGQKRCGLPPDEVKNRLGNITDIDRLERIVLRAVDASTWEEILETP